MSICELFLCRYSTFGQCHCANGDTTHRLVLCLYCTAILYCQFWDEAVAFAVCHQCFPGTARVCALDCHADGCGQEGRQRASVGHVICFSFCTAGGTLRRTRQTRSLVGPFCHSFLSCPFLCIHHCTVQPENTSLDVSVSRATYFVFVSLATYFSLYLDVFVWVAEHTRCLSDQSGSGNLDRTFVPDAWVHTVRPTIP